MDGSLSVLNCAAGDIRVSFDKDDPQEIVRAKRIIKDMLARGYLLFVEQPEGLIPVKKFDPEREVYILADGPTEEPEPAVEGEQPKKKRGRPKGVPMRTTKATGIPRTAGG